MRYKIFFVSGIIFFLGLVNSVTAQSVSKADKIKQLMKPAQKTDYKKYIRNSKNELELTGSVLFLGYKNFISSQDMNSCVFTPSCSVYAIESLKSDNPFKAYVKIFDRLTRCHPFVKPGQYSILEKNHRFYDPVH